MNMRIENKYRILRRINSSGFGDTYIVHDVKDNRQCIMQAFDKTSQCYEAHYHIIVQRAIKAMKLEHPAIAKIVDVMEDDRYIFLVREHIEGETFGQILKKQGAQPIERVIEWSRQLCGVLQYLHTLIPPYIHQELAPDNIVLMPDGKIKLINLRTVLYPNEQYEKYKKEDILVDMIPGYAAPEQWGNSKVDARTDIYRLGMVMHHLITGWDPMKPPYEAFPICQIDSPLPKGLEYIISKCIEKNPNERYKSCNELLADLNRYQQLPERSLFEKLFKKKRI